MLTKFGKNNGSWPLRQARTRCVGPLWLEASLQAPRSQARAAMPPLCSDQGEAALLNFSWSVLKQKERN